MALRNILSVNDPSLRKKSRPETVFNERLHTLLDDMKETLTYASGVGLAAPQVGILRRVAVILETNVDDEEDEYYVELINPEIIMRDGVQSGQEGCLSLPGEVGIVERPMSVVVQALDRQGEFFEFECTGMTARAVCHELDHLDGVLYTDLAERMLSQEEIAALNNHDFEEDYEEEMFEIEEDSNPS